MDREKWTRFATDAEAKAEGDTSRVLVTMLFTDLVGSTELAVELGDRRWRALLERHHTIVRELLDQFRGREVDCAGDGFFATFETATPAVHCGFSLTRSLQSLGLEVRVGLHTGECERFGQKVSGVAVHTAARLSRIARPGEVLVTGTVKDVVAGSGLRFEERDTHTLKGLPGGWQLFAAVGLDLDDSRHGGRDHGLSIRGTRSEVHRAPVKSGVA
jgi:class 3 adenylate cyclase